MTSPLKPFSRAVSSRNRAKPRSFSTISSTRSPGWMSSRSSPTSLTSCAVRLGSGFVQRGHGIAVAVAPCDRPSAGATFGTATDASAAGQPAYLRLGRLRPSRGARRVGHRQVQRERAAPARGRRQPDFAAEQPRQLAADRQAQAGAAVLAAGRAVRLLERLEDDLLLVGGDADAGVGHREGQHARRPGSAPRCPDSSRRRPARTVSVTWPWCVNLNALESRFLMICCRRLASVSIDLRQLRRRTAMTKSDVLVRRRGGTCARRSRAGRRAAVRRHRPRPCPIRSSTGRGCR